MNTAPVPPAAAPPASVVNNIVTKNLLPEQIQRILSGGDSPVEVGGVLCQHVKFTRCSPALQAENATPDLSASLVVVLARRFQGSARSVAFDVPRKYQKLVREYARNGAVAVLGVEVVERRAEKPEPP
jgi:hypothetical protein